MWGPWNRACCEHHGSEQPGQGPGPQGWDTSWQVAGGQNASVTGPLRSAQEILPEGLLCHGLVCGPGGNWVTLGAWHAHRPRTRRMLCVCRVTPRARGGPGAGQRLA